MIAIKPPESNARPYLSRGDSTVTAFVGKPWRALAHGPDAFDCWGLVHTAAHALFGLSFPVAVYAATTPQAVADAAAGMLTAPAWRARPSAAGGVVLALCGYAGDVRHVGLCLDASHVLHVLRATRSCVCPVAKLADAYPVARFYAWAP